VAGTEMGEALATLAFMAPDHGIDSIREGGPLTPFVMHEDRDGQRHLNRFVAETLEEGVGRAREFARDDVPAERIAVAWDGYLTVDGVRSDAIFVEAQETGETSSVILAQRYRPKARLRKFETIGNPALCGHGDLKS
jgi:hypothetical protein